jgi:hypothetical protein
MLQVLGGRPAIVITALPGALRTNWQLTVGVGTVVPVKMLVGVVYQTDSWTAAYSGGIRQGPLTLSNMENVAAADLQMLCM